MAFIAGPASAALSPAPPPDFVHEIRPLLAKYCFDCHSADMRKSELDRERLGDFDAVMQERSVWGGVLEKVESLQVPLRDKEASSRPRAAWTTP